METIKHRLHEILADRGNHAPSNRDFEALLGLSSGRITQLFAPGSAAGLGSDALMRLFALGYNPQWIMYGAPHSKKIVLKPGESLAEPALTPDEREIVQALRMLRDTRRNLHIATILDEAASATGSPPQAKKARR
jgi:hypothetical protein